MSSRVLFVVALCAAAAVSAYFFLSPFTPHGTTDGGAESHHAGADGTMPSAHGAAETGEGKDVSASGERKNEKSHGRLASLMNPGEGDDAFPKISGEDIARFLEKHGETPANLVTAFEKTRDRRLLDRALELFPNSPIVLMAAVDAVPGGPPTKPGEPSVPDPQRMALIERFKAADPTNPLPWVYSAQELFKSGQMTEAVADIRASLDRPAFYTFASERTDSAQRLYEDLGLSPAEAGVVAMAGLTLPHMMAAQQASRSLMDWQKAAAGSGDTAGANDALRLTYSLGRTFATPEASRTLIGQLVGISMEARALKALPADVQPDWLTVTPSQRLAEMETQKQNVRDLTSGVDWLIQGGDEQLLLEYLRRNRNDGELSALTWLKSQRK